MGDFSEKQVIRKMRGIQGDVLCENKGRNGETQTCPLLFMVVSSFLKNHIG